MAVSKRSRRSGSMNGPLFIEERVIEVGFQGHGYPKRLLRSTKYVRMNRAQ
jgi:hypothetical protein